MSEATLKPSTATDSGPHAAALAESGLFNDYPWRIEYRPRRATLGVTVEADAVIVLAVPPGLTPQRLVSAVRKRKATILHHVFAARDRAPQYAVKELVGGEGFDWLGRPMRLRVTDGAMSVRRVHDEWGFWLEANRGDLDAHGAQAIIDWYAAEALPLVVAYAPEWQSRLKLPEVPAFRIRSIKGGRWGAYRPAGHVVDLHWALFQLPRTLVEHVLVSELVNATRPSSSAERAHRLNCAMPVSWQVQRRLDEGGRFVWMGETRSA